MRFSYANIHAVPIMCACAAVWLLGCSDDAPATAAPASGDTVSDGSPVTDADPSDSGSADALADVEPDEATVDAQPDDAGDGGDGADADAPDADAPDADGQDADAVADAGCDPKTCTATKPCELAACEQGACKLTTKQDGAACDDGNACTSATACAVGICAAATAVNCDDGDVCTQDHCDPKAGTCVHAPAQKPAGGPVCACGKDSDCAADGNACTSVACVDHDCKNADLSGSACGDGDSCTTDDACAAGVCKAGPLTSCDDANPCTGDTCAAATGVCANTPVANGSPCDDASACTSGDSCVAGACTPALVTDCGDSDPCTTDACSAATGLCEYATATNGTYCGAGKVCQGRTCVARVNSCAGACGSHVGGCACDDACGARGDCCLDYVATCEPTCPAPPGLPLSSQQISSFAIAPAGVGCDLVGGDGKPDNALADLNGLGTASAYKAWLAGGKWSMLLAADGYTTFGQSFVVDALTGAAKGGCDPTQSTCGFVADATSYHGAQGPSACQPRARMTAFVALGAALGGKLIGDSMTIAVPFDGELRLDLPLADARLQAVVSDASAWKSSVNGLLCGAVHYNALLAALDKLPASAFAKYGGLVAYKKALGGVLVGDVDVDQNGSKESVSVAFTFTTGAAAIDPPQSCTAVGCDDANPCTDDFCVASTGKCLFTARPAGSGCGGGRTCQPSAAGPPRCVLTASCGDGLCGPGETASSCAKDCKSGSCARRCELPYDTGKTCQCDEQCGYWGDCCADAAAVCALPDGCGNSRTKTCSRLAISVLGGCMVDQAGAARCWGENGRGELGSGDALADGGRLRRIPGLSQVRAVAAGTWHRCALKLDGSVWCWGANDHGQVGNGKAANDYPVDAAFEVTPVRVSAVVNGVDLVAGDNTTCAAQADGRVMCWGANGSGQVGRSPTAAGADGTVAIPSAVTGLHDADALAATARSFCARTMAGAVRCWGFNGLGALGDGRLWKDYGPFAQAGSLAAHFAPVAPLLSGQQARVWAGGGMACARDSGGSMRCWGANSDNTLLNGMTAANYPADLAAQATPVAVHAQPNADDFAPSWRHACALTAGTVSCWGTQTHGALGNGVIGVPAAVIKPVAAALPAAATAVATSGLRTAAGDVPWAQSCALLGNDSVWCWGTAVVLSQPSVGLPPSATPAQIEAAPLCADVTECNDGNACTLDACAAGGCRNAFFGYGAACEDGDPCTLPGVCNDATCLAGAVTSCDDGNSCTIDTCNAKTGACSSAAVSDASPCDDGDPCTQPDICAAGACTSGPCNDLACTPPAMATETQVISHLELRFDANGACDLDGDSKPDNAVGKALSLYAGQVSAGLSAQIAAGKRVHLLQLAPYQTDGGPMALVVLVAGVTATDAGCDPSKSAGCAYDVADESYFAPGEKGSLCKARFSTAAKIDKTAFSAGGPSADGWPLRLPMLGLPLDLRLSAVTVDGSIVDSSGWVATKNGRICGVVTQPALAEAINLLAPAAVAALGMDKATLKGILASAFAPDLDLDKDGTKESTSIYLRFETHGVGPPSAP